MAFNKGISLNWEPSRPARASWWTVPRTQDEWYAVAKAEFEERIRGSKEAQKAGGDWMNRDGWGVRRAPKTGAATFEPPPDEEQPLDLRSTESS